MAVYEGKKKHLYPPLVVSVNCSSFKSFYRTCRRNLCHSKSSTDTSSLAPNMSHRTPITTPMNLHSPGCFADGRVAAQAYWQRARQLELELIQLDKWISIEKNLRERVDSYSLDKEKTGKDYLSTKVMKLVDGSYIYESKIIGRHWRRLAIQVSAPAIVPAEIGSNVSQVLQIMATMGTRRLRSWLLESLPMGKIQCNQMEKHAVSSRAGEGFMQEIVFAAMEKMEILVLEGLKLQMGADVKEEYACVADKGNRRDQECVILVMLIQPRDPKKDYKAVEDLMIGFIEASVADKEDQGFEVEGVHVAGISTGSNENKQSFITPIRSCDRKNLGASNFLWSISAKDCEGRCSCHCWRCVKNPKIVIA